MDELNGNGKRGLPKLREILRRQKQDSEDEESPDIEFVYADSDSHIAELAELYSYTEHQEFSLNLAAFEEQMSRFGLGTRWGTMKAEERRRAVLLLLDQVELWDREGRISGARAILYLAQGCWDECMSDQECWDVAKENVSLLYGAGVFSAFIDLLSIETENANAATNAMRKLAVSLADSTELRVILSVLYIMTEVLRTSEDEEMADNFRTELNLSTGEDLLSVKLLSMVTRYCSGSAPHFPMKKVLLLLWKVLLASLGGSQELRRIKSLAILTTVSLAVLVISFSMSSFMEINQYIKTIPAKKTNQEEVWSSIGKAKYIIQTDMYQGFFQNHNDPQDRQWLAIASPNGGLRILLRSGQGQMNSSEDLDELCSRIFQQEITDGICTRQADDIIVLAQTQDELIINWIRVLDRAKSCNIKLSAPKTFVAPDSVDILGWVWSIGGKVSPSPHRQVALKEMPPPQTVRELRKWVGMFKTFLYCTPQLAQIMDPFDVETAAKDSKDLIHWTSELTEAFDLAKNHISQMKALYLPHPDDQLVIIQDGNKNNDTNSSHETQVPCIGVVLYAIKNKELLPVRYYSAKLQPYQKKWFSCEVEGVSLGVAVVVFMPYLRETNLPVIVCTDCKPVKDAAKLMQSGHFSSSPRLQTFLNNINKVPIQIKHISGKIGQTDIPDFLARNAQTCKSASHPWHLCQVCRFIQENSEALLDQDIRIGLASVQQLLQPNSPIPIANRNGWRREQLKDPACKIAIENLRSGRTPSNKVGVIPTQVRKYCSMATIAKDGLLVVKAAESELSTVSRERIVIPALIFPAIMWQLHFNLIHPEKDQLKKVYLKFFFAVGYAKVLDNIYDTCNLCWSLQKLPPEILEFSTKTEPKHPGTHFSADVIRRAVQKILVVRDHFSSFTGGMFIQNEQHSQLRDGLMSLITPLRYATPVEVIADNAPGFKTMHRGDPHLQKLLITVKPTNVMNKNANAVIDKGIQELEKEITKLSPQGQPISQTVLSQALNICNQRLRRDGTLSAMDIQTNRDCYTGEIINVQDQAIAHDQKRRRNISNEYHNRNIPENLKKSCLDFAVGDLVHCVAKPSKHKARETFIVTGMDGDMVIIQKMIPINNGSLLQLRSTEYRVKPSQIFKSPCSVQAPRHTVKPEIVETSPNQNIAAPSVPKIEKIVTNPPSLFKHGYPSNFTSSDTDSDESSSSDASTETEDGDDNEQGNGDDHNGNDSEGGNGNNDDDDHNPDGDYRHDIDQVDHLMATMDSLERQHDPQHGNGSQHWSPGSQDLCQETAQLVHQLSRRPAAIQARKNLLAYRPRTRQTKLKPPRSLNHPVQTIQEASPDSLLLEPVSPEPTKHPEQPAVYDMSQRWRSRMSSEFDWDFSDLTNTRDDSSEAGDVFEPIDLSDVLNENLSEEVPLDLDMGPSFRCNPNQVYRLSRVLPRQSTPKSLQLVTRRTSARRLVQNAGLAADDFNGRGIRHANDEKRSRKARKQSAEKFNNPAKPRPESGKTLSSSRNPSKKSKIKRWFLKNAPRIFHFDLGDQTPSQ